MAAHLREILLILNNKVTFDKGALMSAALTIAKEFRFIPRKPDFELMDLDLGEVTSAPDVIPDHRDATVDHRGRYSIAFINQGLQGAIVDITGGSLYRRIVGGGQADQLTDGRTDGRTDRKSVMCVLNGTVSSETRCPQ